MTKKKSKIPENKKGETKQLDSTTKAREEITGIEEEEKPHTKGEKINAKIRGEI